MAVPFITKFQNTKNLKTQLSLQNTDNSESIQMLFITRSKMSSLKIQLVFKPNGVGCPTVMLCFVMVGVKKK